MQLQNKTLLLIDGSSYIYRAFHAISALSNTAGEPTNALFGVLNMLKKIEDNYIFDYCCFVCDAKGKNFRHKLFKDYKATRKPMPDDLRPQVEWIKELVDLMGWNVLVVDGVEADDVIATLTKKAKATKMQVIISTGDKDIAQLVDDSTTMINTMTDEILDVAGVKNKFGVFPEQIVDYLTLVGDSSDNIKGVKKCGAKTAVKWLDEYRTLENLLAHADDIKGKVGENLRLAQEWLSLSHTLITLKDDVLLSEYLPNGIEDLNRKPENWDLLLPQLHRFGFKKWIKDIEKKGIHTTIHSEKEYGTNFTIEKNTLKPQLPSHVEDRAIKSKEDLNNFLVYLNQAKRVGFDTETTSLDQMQARLVGMSFSFQTGEKFYIPLDHHWLSSETSLDMAQTLVQLKPYLENPQLEKIGQNLKYDQHVLKNHDIVLKGIVGDSMLASYIIESHLGHGLDELAERHLGMTTIKYEDLCGKGAKQISFAQVPLKEATHYACQDADLSLHLEKYLVSLMSEAQRKLYYDMELPILEILARMERYGVLIDKQELQKQSHELAIRILAIEQEVYQIVGQVFNLNSPKQMQEILFNILKIPTQGLNRTPKGDISTSEEVLEKLAQDYQVPRLILEYRSLTKLKSTYTDKLSLLLDENNRVHTTYAQAVVNTGRLASNNPNLQNIPVRTQEGRKIRQAFIAPPKHKIISADYSQIELRIMAHLSGDENLIQCFNNNEDIHRTTASKIFHIPFDEVKTEQRRYAKTINFGLIYGMSQYGLAKSLNIDSSEAKSFIDQYFNEYPGVLTYMQQTKLQAHKMGYVETIFGRKLYLNNINSNNARLRSSAERAAINAPMQGTASDLIKLAMINVQNWLDKEKLQTQMIMQVHDELVFEVPEQELKIIHTHIRRLMTSIVDLKVPLVVDIGEGDNWETAH
ncbi:MAG: DNA polymerase I [Neisseriaceae bacterium]|nr:MAG: DNA polymerase I [Neisseriaceae bacterium]